MAGLSSSERFWKGQLRGCAFAAAIVGTAAIGATHADAQETGQSGAPLAFEVASVKLHIQGSGGGRSDPARFVLGGVSVASLLSRAYGLQRQQLVGPEWMDSVLLDIDAKMPEGSDKEQIPRMLQTLLADRLKLAVHWESRTISLYELTVGKDGPKMKEVDPSKFIDAIMVGNGGSYSPHPGLCFIEGHLTMAKFAGELSYMSLDRYVLDSTHLNAIYDVHLTWAPDDTGGLQIGGTPGAAPLSVAAGPSNIFPAIQQELGLKLESRRAPVEVLVVDHVERVPTAN
jgi:uncharacterized protein (TIGR03435 family)